MPNLHEGQPMHRTRHQAQEAMFSGFDQGAKADRQNLLRGMVSSINALVDQTTDANLNRFPLQEVPKEKRNRQGNYLIRDALRVAAAGVAGATAGAALTDTLPATAQTSLSTKDQATVWEMPPHFPTSERAYQQMLANHPLSIKQPAERTLVAGNQKESSNPEMISSYKIEHADKVSIKGTKIAIIAIFPDGKKHLVVGDLFDSTNPPKDLGILSSIVPFSVTINGDIIAVAGSQPDKLDEGVLYVSKDYGKTWINILNTKGQYLSPSIPDNKYLFATKGDKMAENQPVGTDIFELDNLSSLSMPIVTTNLPAGTAINSQIFAEGNDYSYVTINYRATGYQRINTTLPDGSTSITNVNEGPNSGFLTYVPVDFMLNGKKITLVISWYTLPTGQLNYNENDVPKYVIKPNQQLAPRTSPNYGVFGESGAAFLGTSAGKRDETTNELYFVSHILKLPQNPDDYQDPTKQTILTVFDHATLASMYLVKDTSGRENLFAVLDTGVFQVLPDGTQILVDIKKDDPPPTPTPTPTSTPTPTPTPTVIAKFFAYLGNVAKNALRPGW